MEQWVKTINKCILVIALIFSNSALAKVQPIKQGDTATYDGFLFDHDSENEAEQDRTNAAFYKELSDKQAEKIALQDKESSILDQRLQLYINESNVLIKDKAQNDVTERLFLIGSFALGVIATALVVRNVKP